MMILAAIPLAFAGTHPCEATFEAKINEKSSWLGTNQLGVTLKEPTWGYCKYFNVTIYIEDVVDMYAFEFNLTWTNHGSGLSPNDHFVLDSYEVFTDYWANAIVVQPDINYDLYNVGDPATFWFKMVAAAIAPSTGFTGTAKVARLSFHIFNDVAWTAACGQVKTYFDFEDMKVSGSCSNDLAICTPLNGYLKFRAIQPSLYFVPNSEENDALPGKFTKTLWIKDITKMKSLCFNLTWNIGDVGDPLGAWNPYDPYYDYKWPQVIVEKVKILVTEPLMSYTILHGPDVDVVVGAGTVHVDTWLYVCFEIKDAPYASLMNGTFPLVAITFEKQDPWFCGRQPWYYFDQPHEVFTYPCITDFWFESGWIDVMCDLGKDYIYFGTIYGDTRADYNVAWNDHIGFAKYFDYLQGYAVGADFTSNIYMFTAIPGDLNLDGKVDITDVMIEASYYGADVHVYPNMYYDLNGDGVIDIYDIVIVTKNFGRTSP